MSNLSTPLPTAALTPSTPNTSIFPNLDATFLSDIDIPQASYLKTASSEVKQLRQDFLDSWLELLQLEKAHTYPHIFLLQDPSVTRDELTAARKVISSTLQHRLKQYSYHLYKNELTLHKILSVDQIIERTNNLKENLKTLGGKPEDVDHLIQAITLTHGVQLEFKSRTLRLLQKEALVSYIAYEKEIHEHVEQYKDLTKSIARKVDKATRPLHAQLAEEQSKVEELKQELNSYSIANQKQGDKIGELQRLINANRDEESKKFTAGQDELKTAYQQIETLTEELNNAKGDLETISETRIVVEKETLQLQDEVIRLQTIISSLQNEKSSLTDDKTELENQLKQKARNLHSYEDTINILEDRIEELRKQLSDELTERGNLEDQLQDEIKLRDQEILNLKNTLIKQTQPNRTRTPSPVTMAPTNDPLSIHYKEIISREDKKSIPFYKGNSSEILVTDWLKKAERIATNNDWDNNQRIRFFSDRLKSEAADWHADFIAANATGLQDYEGWKTAFIERFRDEADMDKLRSKLKGLKQHSEQKTRAFISKINNLYDTINGKEKPEPRSTEAKELAADIRKRRDKDKRNILLRGLLPKIKTELWPRIAPDDSFQKLCEHAIIAENIVLNKELCEGKEVNAVIANISQHEEQQDREISKQKIDIEILKSQINQLTLNNDDQTDSQDKRRAHTVAVADNYRPRSLSGDRRPGRPNHTVQFRDPPSRPQSADRGFNRSQGTENPYYRGRSPSADRYQQD